MISPNAFFFSSGIMAFPVSPISLLPPSISFLLAFLFCPRSPSVSHYFFSPTCFCTFPKGGIWYIFRPSSWKRGGIWFSARAEAEGGGQFLPEAFKYVFVKFANDNPLITQNWQRFITNFTNKSLSNVETQTISSEEREISFAQMFFSAL